MQACPALTIWDQVLSRIEDQVGKHSFSTWFKPTTLLADGGQSLSIRVPNLLFVEWLPKHYSVVLAEALRDVGRPDVKLVFVPDDAGLPPGYAPPSRPRSTRPSAGQTRVTEVPDANDDGVSPVPQRAGSLIPALHLRHVHRRTVESVCARRVPRGGGNAVAFV